MGVWLRTGGPERLRGHGLALVCALGLAACVAAPDQTREPPDFVVIFFDDLGFSDLGAYGGEIATPNIDALAARGLIVSQFYNHARCTPSRATLLTGVYPHQAGLASSVHRPGAPRPDGPNQGYLDESVLTLAEVLGDAGYRSYLSGKWHVGEDRPSWPVDRGFHRSWGLISGASGYFGIVEEPRRRTFAEDGAAWTPPQEGFYLTTEIGLRASAYITDHVATYPESPFLLYVPFTAPHYPLHAPESAVEAVGDRYEAGWDHHHHHRAKAAGAVLGGRDHAPAPRPASSPAWNDAANPAGMARRMAVYAAMVEAADAEVGRIVRTLKASGRFDNTLILILSDNGASNEDVQAERGLSEPGAQIGARGSYESYLEPWAWVSNAPFENFKKSLMEGGVRTPFIAHWPAGLGEAARLETERWGTLTDLAPTLYSLAGADYAALAARTGAPPLEGVDLSPVLFGTPGFESRPPYFWEHNGWAAVRQDDWKAVRPGEGASWRLYDLADDPTEQADLSAAQPERLGRMTADWQAWAARVGVE